MSALWTWLFSQYQDYSPTLMALELTAAVFGLLSVLLVKRGKILAYPVGLVSTALYVYLLWQWQLFGDMLINAYYSLMSIYGWLNWSNAVNAKTAANLDSVPIKKTSAAEWRRLSVMMAATFVFVALIYYFKPVINNNFSFDGVVLGFGTLSWMDWMDVLTTGLFLVAMWLMAERRLEHWAFWIVADAISVPLYFYKGMMFTSLQYLLFTLIAISAHIAWVRRYRQQVA